MTEVIVKFRKLELKGSLVVPAKAGGLILFAYGAGSSRFSSRENFVAEKLQKKKFATLLMDLLTPPEEKVDEITREYRFNIPLLAERLLGAMRWLRKNKMTAKLPLGLFGGSTGAAACLIAAAQSKEVKAVVSRGGRTDLADEYLSKVRAATLFIVGSFDPEILALNKSSLKLLKEEKKIEMVPGASHLFEEPGKLEEVARLAGEWFERYL